jgi:hypothetical protein
MSVWRSAEFESARSMNLREQLSQAYRRSVQEVSNRLREADYSDAGIIGSWLASQAA